MEVAQKLYREIVLEHSARDAFCERQPLDEFTFLVGLIWGEGEFSGVQHCVGDAQPNRSEVLINDVRYFLAQRLKREKER